MKKGKRKTDEQRIIDAVFHGDASAFHKPHHTPMPLNIVIDGGDSSDEYFLEIPVEGTEKDAEALRDKILRAVNAYEKDQEAKGELIEMLRTVLFQIDPKSKRRDELIRSAGDLLAKHEAAQ